MEKKLHSILLIDDDEPTNFLNKRMLENMHCAEKVQVIQKAPEALEHLKKLAAQDTEPSSLPDIIFLDINMPAMDGWEFLEAFRAVVNKKQKNILLVMLTTSLNPDDEQKAKETKQVTAFKHKPLSQEIVKDILMRYYAA
jgi:CheY-like chemotaxis protein